MRVLLVEDDSTLRQQLEAVLRRSSYTVDAAVDAPVADELALTEPYDAIVLDLGLPGGDGISLLRRWRSEGVKVPVLILTARGTWPEKVEGIDAGADDYMSKPFQVEELLARLRALIRRAAGHAQPTLVCGPLTFDSRAGSFTLLGNPVDLSAHEHKILAFLIHHQEEIVSRTELMEHTYGLEGDRDSNTIDVFIVRLRKKIGAERIQTIRGLGYRLCAT